MWIFTESGFVSAVCKTDNPSVLTVRSRDKQSLEQLATDAGAQIAQSPDADYPDRVFVEQEVFAQWAFEQSMAVSYNNFKNRVAKSRGYEFASALGNVWVAMLKVEDEQARTNEKTAVPDVTQEDRDNAKKGYPNQTFSDKDLEMLKALGHL